MVPLGISETTQAVDEQRAEQAAAVERVVTHALATMAQHNITSIMTLSRSSTVQRVLQVLVK